MMKAAFLAAALLGIPLLGLGVGAGPVAAQERVTLGFARLFTNDALGDTHDRWRSGAYSVSRFRGDRWGGSLPDTFGVILEQRLRAEIIAPESLTTRNPDRLYAGVIAPGLATHWALMGMEARLGGELVFTGPQTKVGAFQREVHQGIGLDRPSVLGSQIPDGVHPTVNLELGRTLSLSQRVSLRPFAEAQAGVEDYVRVGGDLVLGRFGHEGLFTRDTVTGQRVLGITGTADPGLSFTLGADMARVFDSAYMPARGPATPEDLRGRLRAGLHWQGERSDAFYGVTWLGKEFDAQPEGQVVGSVRLNLRF
ncbi:lipid A-modifier LpxR family protein [Gemmobacter serpentinus]|uniref:lipid A-modifier LpxR family protein n=1 Tax=Gemmobacter serpentinus TaxID=2652247 RepID=UPI00124DEA8D|nr:lipid A-modifier LpxR family protein [Gemmobacter serpentinus]